MSADITIIESQDTDSIVRKGERTVNGISDESIYPANITRQSLSIDNITSASLYTYRPNITNESLFAVNITGKRTGNITSESQYIDMGNITNERICSGNITNERICSGNITSESLNNDRFNISNESLFVGNMTCKRTGNITSGSDCTESIANESQYTQNTSSVSINTELVCLDLSRLCSLPLGVAFHGQRTRDNISDDGIYVSAIQSGSIAQLDGRLNTGDVILEINDINIEEMPNAKALFIVQNEISKAGPLRMLVGRYYVDSPSVLEALTDNSETQGDRQGLVQPRRASPSMMFVGVQLIDWVKDTLFAQAARSDAVAYVEGLHVGGYINTVDANGYRLESSSFSQLDWFTFSNEFMESGYVMKVENCPSQEVNEFGDMKLLAIC